MKKLSLVTLLFILFAFAAPTFAGGWAVVTLDRLPTNVIAGQPQTIGFMVRQHGMTPMKGLSPSITFRKTGGSDVVYATAASDETVGHYTAKVTLPSAGAWIWTIESFSFPAPMPTLMVSEPILTTTAPLTSSTPSIPALSQLIGVAGLIGAVGASIALARTRASWAAALVLGAMLVSVTGFATVSTPTSKESPPVLTSNGSLAAPSGKDLFLAKGCATCHAHSAVEIKHITVEVGPNLTHFSAAPEYLRQWLKNPKSIKSLTEMPTLGLGDDEIEALITFINAK